MRVSFLKKKQPTVVAPIEPAVPIAGAKYQVMPEKFYVTVVNRRFWSAPKVWTVVVVLIVALVGVTYWLLSSVNQQLPSPEPEAAPVELPTDTIPTILPTEEIVPLPPTSPIVAPSTLSVILPPTTDTDGDGLTEDEEALWGTDAGKPDTDGDGYPDRSEILTNHNPRGVGALQTASIFSTYVDPAGKFQILYPSTWTAAAEGGAVKFVAANGEGVAVLLQPNPTRATVQDWYANLAGTQASDVSVGRYGNNPGVLSPDGSTVYLSNAAQDTIIIVSLTTTGKAAVSYRSTHLFMVNTMTALATR
ncbi:MAG: hypothetical protein WC052_05405 [Patescibacteria group bacterium]|jgi:hypothetical protein